MRMFASLSSGGASRPAAAPSRWIASIAAPDGQKGNSSYYEAAN